MIGLGGVNPPETITVGVSTDSGTSGFGYRDVTFEYDFTLSNPATLTADFNIFDDGEGDSTAEQFDLALYETPSLGVTNLLTSASALGDAHAVLTFALVPGVLYSLTGDGQFFDWNFFPNADSYQGSLKFTVAATPLPPALLMFATALAGLGGLGYSRRRSANAV